MKARRGPAQNPADFVVRETATSPPALSSASVGPARQLGAFLRVAETGYAICVCNAPAERRRILDSLLPELMDKDIGIFELELDRTVETIPGRIRVALTTDAFRALAIRFSTVAISLTGAEATITDAERKSAGRPRVLQGLNQQRDWMDQLGRPIIFWVSEWLLGLLPRVAPDFWAGRSVVIEFPTADENRARACQEISSGPWTFSSLDEAKRKIRIYEDLLRGETDPKTRAGFLHNLAIIHQSLGDLAKAHKLYNQSMAIARELGSKFVIARTLHQLAMLAQDRGDYAEARKLYDESFAIKQEIGDKSGAAQTLHQLGMLAQAQGDHAEARKLYDQSLAINNELGDKSGIANTLAQLAQVAHIEGDLTAAVHFNDESLRIRNELGDRSGVAKNLHEGGILRQTQGDLAEARKLYDESLALFRELGDKAGVARTLGQVANLAMDQGDYNEARTGYEKTLTVFEELGNKAGITTILHQLANLAYLQGNYTEARKLYDQSLAIAQELGSKFGVAITTGQLGRLAEAEEDDRTALKNYLAALAIFEELKSPHRDLTMKLIARMRQRLGEAAFKKLHDEVVAELSKKRLDSERRPTADN